MTNVRRMMMAASAGITPATVTFEAAYTSGAGTVHTIVGADLGSAGTKKVIVPVNSYDGAVHTIVSVTVDGETAFQVVEEASTVSGYNAQIWQCNTATAATGDIVVTTSAGVSGVFIASYAALGAAASASDTGVSDANPGNASIDCPAGGFIIGCAIYQPASNISWTNLTEDNEDVLESTVRASQAHDEFAAAQTARSITATYAGSPVRYSMVLASWGPE